MIFGVAEAAASHQRVPKVFTVGGTVGGGLLAIAITYGIGNIVETRV